MTYVELYRWREYEVENVDLCRMRSASDILLTSILIKIYSTRWISVENIALYQIFWYICFKFQCIYRLKWCKKSLIYEEIFSWLYLVFWNMLSIINESHLPFLDFMIGIVWKLILINEGIFIRGEIKLLPCFYWTMAKECLEIILVA